MKLEYYVNTIVGYDSDENPIYEDILTASVEFERSPEWNDTVQFDRPGILTQSIDTDGKTIYGYKHINGLQTYHYTVIISDPTDFYTLEEASFAQYITLTDYDDVEHEGILVLNSVIEGFENMYTIDFDIVTVPA